MILREAFQCGTMAHMLDERQKRLRRNELARFYHWKQRNLLAPLNLHKRQFYDRSPVRFAHFGEGIVLCYSLLWLSPAKPLQS